MIRKLKTNNFSKIVFTLTMLLNVLYYVSGRIFHQRKDDMFYILQWTLSKTGPFPSMESGQDAFVFRKCTFQNCYITNDTGYLKNIKYFDVLLINVVDMHKDLTFSLPNKRAMYQKYVFVSRESYVNYPVSQSYDGYFNWTWTHRLDSDIKYNYIAVRDEHDRLIAPKDEMHWIDILDMKPTKKYVERKLRKKRYAAAWFVSNCEAQNKRLEFGNSLKTQLAKYGQILHIYGNCGDMKCPTDGLWEGCFALIEHDYYFYLSFENAHSKDYVSEKVLNALNHFAVPVVFGGANYTKFMPKGVYLDATALGVEKLALEMDNIIRDKERYYNFFKWHNHYSYYDSTDSPETDGICDLCAKLNNYTLRTAVSIHSNFSAWWNETLKNENEKNRTQNPIDIYEDYDEDSTTKVQFTRALQRGQYVAEIISRISEFIFGHIDHALSKNVVYDRKNVH